MISKVLPADSVYHTCRYIMAKQEAKVIASEGLRVHDYRLTARDFETQRSLRPEKNKACFHAVLSFAPGENLSDEKMKELAETYLGKLGIRNTQYLVVRHHDREHQHMHVVANMVDREGEVISDRYIGYRGKKAAQELTRHNGLKPAWKKELSATNLEELNRKEAVKYAIYRAILQALPRSRSLEELADRLAKQGIEMRLKFKGKTSEVQGISFRKDGLSFKGSEVDRHFSYGKIRKVLDHQRKEERVVLHPVPDKQGKETLKELDGNLSKIMEAIQAPEGGSMGINPALMREEQKKRKQKNRNRDGLGLG